MARNEHLPVGIHLAWVAGALLVGVPLLALAWVDPELTTYGPAADPEPILFALRDPLLLSLLGSSVAVAMATTLCAVMLGVPTGLWFATHAHRPGARALFSLHLLPLCLPPYLLGLGSTYFVGARGPIGASFGPEAASTLRQVLYAPGGLVVILTLALGPLVSLATALFTRRIAPEMLESGMLCRHPDAVVRRIILPVIAPGIAMCALLVFVFALSETALAQLLSVRVYASAVFTQLADLSFAPGVAISRAIPPLVLAVFVALALGRLDRRIHASLGTRQALPDGLRRSAMCRIWGRVSVATMLLLAAFPLLGLVGQASATSNLPTTSLTHALPALANSLRHAALATAFMLALALPIAWGMATAASTTYGRLRSLSISWGLLPLLIGLLLPSAVLGTGLILAWNRPSTAAIYDSSAILVLALSARYAYLPARMLAIAFERIPRNWIEAATLAHRSPRARFTKIVLPTNIDTLVGATLLAFLLCLRDLDTSIMLYPPSAEPLPIRIMTLEANAPPGTTATMALLHIAVTALVLGALAAVARRART